MRIAITREISPALARCELTHLARQPIDLERAREQHQRYEACLTDLGCAVQRLPADSSLPDSVFVEDTALVFDELAILTRPGAPSRRAEVAAMAAALAPHRSCVSIIAPATLDGGDVLAVGRTVYVGVSGRTNAQAVEQLRGLLEPHAYRVQPVPVTGCLHLKSAMSRVGPDTVLLHPGWVSADDFSELRKLEIDAAEPFAANALLIDETVVYPAEHPRTAERLERQGIRVRRVEASELAKAEGGVTCCCVLVPRAGQSSHR